jgi:hypothetical protein
MTSVDCMKLTQDPKTLDRNPCMIAVTNSNDMLLKSIWPHCAALSLMGLILLYCLLSDHHVTYLFSPVQCVAILLCYQDELGG